MRRNYNEINEEINVIDKIKENTIVYITTEEDGEMMFMCQRVGRGFTLYNKDNGHYFPIAENLEELKDMLHKDCLNGIIKDINIYDDDGGQAN